MGENCAINPSAYFADPGLISIGNNVRIAGGFFAGHDGSVNMVNRALGTKLDSVGSIRILDDVFVGYGVIVLPNTTIGPRAIVGAGAVVAKDVPPNSVVVGNPARVVSSFDEHVESLKRRNADWPWSELVARRSGSLDAALEPKLLELRRKYFFGGSSP